MAGEIFVPHPGNRVLVINPGSTSTKFGVFTMECAEWVSSVHHGDEELNQFRGRSMLARTGYRAALIEKALVAAGYDPKHFAAVGGRGGFLPPMACGTYLVDDALVEELRLARRGEHASNLGAVLALRFAQAAGVNAYVVDPVTVDEWQDCARISGSPLIERSCVGHALNIKAVARRFARESARAYADLRLIIAHMGSGITVSAHRGGRMIDNNTPEEGPLGPDRTGTCRCGNSSNSAAAGSTAKRNWTAWFLEKADCFLSRDARPGRGRAPCRCGRRRLRLPLCRR